MKTLQKLKLSVYASLFAVSGTLFATSTIDLSKSIADNGITPTGIYWQFDNDTTDSSGNGYTGTLNAGRSTLPYFVSGKFGQALYLPGTPRVSPSDDNNPNATWVPTAPVTSGDRKIDFYQTDFTVGTWINFNSVMSGVEQTVYVVERGASTSNNDYMSFQLKKTENDNWRMVLQMGGYNISPGTALIQSTTTSGIFNTTGEWNHIAFTFQYNAEGDNTVLFYLNGEQFGDPMLTGFNARDLSGSGVNNVGLYRFTAGERNASPPLASSFDGALDDLFVTAGAYSFAPIPELGTIALIFGGVIFGFLFIRRSRNKA